jgi:hypothetical protein
MSDPTVRREILEEFFFSLATFLDGCAGRIVVESCEYRPRLVFEDLKEPGKLIVSDRYDLHDYTHSDIGALFEEDAK